jgi:chloramphenicol 3-O-phosphotransferase
MTSVHLITGIPAAGKSTVAQALAERLDGPSVHVHGDRFRRWILNGRADMTPDAAPEALRQLRLRHALTARICDAYADAGFTVVAQDVLLGEHLGATVSMIRTRPLHVVVLAPRAETVARRDAERSKNAYDAFTIAALDRVLRKETPCIGTWIDSSDLTVAQTVDEILCRTGPPGT